MESMNWEHRHLSSLVCALEILIASTHYCTNNFSMTSRKFKSTHSNSNISQLRKDNVYKNRIMHLSGGYPEFITSKKL